MNLLKKLKLVLLASGVILSPKGGYAADHERDDAHKMLTRPGPSQPFNSMLPLSVLNELSASPSSSSLPQFSDEHLLRESVALFGRADVVNTSIRQYIVNLHKQNPADEVNDIIKAIRVNLIEKFALPEEISFQKSMMQISDSKPSDLQKIVAYALTLPKEEIVARSIAMRNMVSSLCLKRGRGHGLLPSFAEDNGLIYFKDQKESLIVVDNVLRLNSHQIAHRTNMINENRNYLLPKIQSGHVAVIGFLMKLQTEDIRNRAGIMRMFMDKLRELSLFGTDKRSQSQVDKIVVTASQLDTVDLMSRISNALESPVLKLIASSTESISNIFTLSFDQFNKRIATIKQYEGLLSESLRSSGGSERVANLMGSTVYEIYKMASNQLCAAYFEKDFLPKLGEEFRKLNRSQLKDADIFRILLPSHFSNPQHVDFSPENVRERLSVFGSVYSSLYNPPSLSEPVLTAGPSSSSGPLASSQVSIEDSSIPFNSSFKGASPSGAVPQGYTFVADPAQKAKKYGPTSVTQIEAGHVAVKGDGYVFYQQLTASAMKALDGQSFEFMVDVKSDTPGAYIQYWSYPDHEKLMSTSHKGLGGWETLRINFTVDGNNSQFFLYPVIMPAVSEGLTAPVVEVKNLRLLRRS